MWSEVIQTNNMVTNSTGGTLFYGANLAAARDVAFILPANKGPSDPSGFLASSDGVNWTAHSFGLTNLCTGLAFGLNTYVAVGSAGILQSDPVSDAPPVPATLGCAGFPTISVSGEVGRYYQIQSAAGLSGTNNFQVMTNLLLTTSPTTWTDLTASNAPCRFYRAALLYP